MHLNKLIRNVASDCSRQAGIYCGAEVVMRDRCVGRNEGQVCREEQGHMSGKGGKLTEGNWRQLMIIQGLGGGKKGERTHQFGFVMCVQD